MRNPFKILVLAIVVLIVLSSCTQDVPPVSEASSVSQEGAEIFVNDIDWESSDFEVFAPPQKESLYRVIFAEPKENIENHTVTHEGFTRLILWSAVHSEEITIEYYNSHFFDEEGNIMSDSPTWVTLLVRKNDMIYPLQSLVPNFFVRSILLAKSPSGDNYVIWLIVGGADGLQFFEYTYDSEKDAFIGTQIHEKFFGTWPIVYRDELQIGRDSQ